MMLRVRPWLGHSSVLRQSFSRRVVRARAFSTSAARRAAGPGARAAWLAAALAGATAAAAWKMDSARGAEKVDSDLDSARTENKAEREIREKFFPEMLGKSGSGSSGFEYDDGVEHALYDELTGAGVSEKRQKSLWKRFKALFSLAAWKKSVGWEDDEDAWGDGEDGEDDDDDEDGEGLDLLPPPTAINANGAPPRTLVIEPFDFLVRPVYRRQYGWRFLMRPGALYWLNRMAVAKYEIVAWTRLARQAAENWGMQFNSDGHIQHWLYRDAMSGSQKDLSRLGRDLSRVISIDCHEWRHKLNPENALTPSIFYGDPQDNLLLELAVLLEDIQRANPRDVRPVLAKWRENPMATYEELFGHEEWMYEHAKAAIFDEQLMQDDKMHRRVALTTFYWYRMWEDFFTGHYRHRMGPNARRDYATIIPHGEEYTEAPVRGAQNLPSGLMTHEEALLVDEWPTKKVRRVGIREVDEEDNLFPEPPEDRKMFWDMDTMGGTDRHGRPRQYDPHNRMPDPKEKKKNRVLTGFPTWYTFSLPLLNTMEMPPGESHGPLPISGFRQRYGKSPMRVFLEMGEYLQRKNEDRADWVIERGNRSYTVGHDRPMTAEEIDKLVDEYESKFAPKAHVMAPGVRHPTFPANSSHSSFLRGLNSNLGGNAGDNDGDLSLMDGDNNNNSNSNSNYDLQSAVAYTRSARRARRPRFPGEDVGEDGFEDRPAPRSMFSDALFASQSAQSIGNSSGFLGGGDDATSGQLDSDTARSLQDIVKDVRKEFPTKPRGEYTTDDVDYPRPYYPFPAYNYLADNAADRDEFNRRDFEDDEFAYERGPQLKQEFWMEMRRMLESGEFDNDGLGPVSQEALDAFPKYEHDDVEIHPRNLRADFLKPDQPSGHVIVAYADKDGQPWAGPPVPRPEAKLNGNDVPLGTIDNVRIASGELVDLSIKDVLDGIRIQEEQEQQQQQQQRNE